MSDFYQALFTKISNLEKGTWKMDFSPNGPWLPDYPEIDEMVRILNSLKSKEVRKEWGKYFKKVEEKNDKMSKHLSGLKETENKGHIYLIKSNSLYKIGRAKNPKERIRGYKTQNPFGIKVIFQKEVKDCIQTENDLLKKFQNKKFKGEWFKLNKEDILWIKENI